jgi:hypothetical protein
VVARFQQPEQDQRRVGSLVEPGFGQVVGIQRLGQILGQLSQALIAS